MKKTIVTTLAMAMICAMSMACGNKSGKAGDDASADSSLMNEEAVASRVKDVYKYLNDVRHYYTVTPPDKIDYDKWESPDKHFGTQEWIAVRDRVDAIDRECECSGFFDFGERGPLDIWQYDCFEGDVTPSDIKVRLNDDGTAQVDFKIKDVTTIDPVPMRWIMRLEDGEWRVDNVFFVPDGNMDLRQAMGEYVEQGGSRQYDGIPEDQIAPPELYTEEAVASAARKYIERVYDTQHANVDIVQITAELLTCNIAQASVILVNTESLDTEEIHLDFDYYADGGWIVRTGNE